MSEGMKKFTPYDKGIKLVSKPNDIDPYGDADPGVLRAVLSCGHVTDPEALTTCCSAQLKDGETEFTCPECENKWPYDEVRKLGKLTIEEQMSFEETLGMNTAKKIVDFRECPGCGTLIERMDVANLRVECTVCTENEDETYEFCWNCMGEWKKSTIRANWCGNKGCTTEQKQLKHCPMITLTYFRDSIVQCPKIRACTSCEMLIEHTTKGCNNMECPQCDIEFCFICLKAGHDYDDCQPCKLAPRQVKCD